MDLKHVQISSKKKRRVVCHQVLWKPSSIEEVRQRASQAGKKLFKILEK